jgi:hypothetical protein
MNMGWQSTTTHMVASRTVGRFTIFGMVALKYKNYNTAVWVTGDDPVEHRANEFVHLDEALMWVEEVIGEIAREASWQTL